MKLKTPLKAEEVTKDYPGFVLLESEDVKHYGTRAKPLQPHQNLEPKRVYFLVELPQNVIEGSSRVRVRKVRSGIQMSAKDRLESLMLSRRSVSDIGGGDHGIGRMRRVRMVVPKVEMDRLMSEAKSEEEIADKIVQLCLNKNNNGGGGNNGKIGLREVCFLSFFNDFCFVSTLL